MRSLNHLNESVLVAIADTCIRLVYFVSQCRPALRKRIDKRSGVATNGGVGARVDETLMFVV